MPGQFILLGFFVARIVEWVYTRNIWGKLLSYGSLFLIAIIIVGQFVGSTASIADASRGNYTGQQPPFNYYNDLGSLQHALHEADRLATQYHFNRVYVTTDFVTHTAMNYLAEQMQTPTTLFDDSRCLILPNAADGPAVMLVGPYSMLTNALLIHFASAALVEEPVRLGGPPFRLYIVNPGERLSNTNGAFTHHLELLNASPQNMSFNNRLWMVTRWNLLQSAAPSYRKMYSYQFQAILNGDNKVVRSSNCVFSAMRMDDQILVAFSLPLGNSLPSALAIQGEFMVTRPYNLSYGPVILETGRSLNAASIVLLTIDGKHSITLSNT
jgi:hypothetical protein